MRRTLLTLALVLAMAPQAHAAWSFQLGIGEQQTAMFGDPRFEALGVKLVRVVTAWNVVVDEVAPSRSSGTRPSPSRRDRSPPATGTSRGG